MPHRLTGPIALALGALLVLAACSGTSEEASTTGEAATTTEATTGGGDEADADASPAERVPESFDAADGGDFYAVPDPLPAGAHGDLVRYEELDLEVPGATAYRIMYLSESLAGEPIAVTGLASVPTAAAPADGRPMVTISHGTTGIADECAPSKDPTQNEFTLVSGTMADTHLIAATDYEGLGTPGRHPYLVGESEGRGSIDAILAAGQLPDADAGTKLAIVGYSQGGHGAIWTNQVAAEWAPELEVVGTFAGAPASEVDVILAAAPYLPQAGFAYMIVAGFEAAYPEADADDFLTPQGAELLDAVDVGCTEDTFAAVAGYSPADLIQPDAAQTEPWRTLAEANDAGTAKTNDAPTLVIHSTGDGTVPLAFTEMLQERMCGLGQVIERRLIDAGGHGPAAIPAYEQAFTWLEQRFADDAPAPVSTCPA